MEGRFLVTGAASGIGAAVARRLAGEGAFLLLHTGTRRDALEAVARDCRERGATCALCVGDLAEPALAQTLVDEAERAFGGLDALIANAGFADRRALEALDDAAFARSVDAILTGFFRLARAAQPVLVRSRRGRIVAVSSFVAHVFRLDGIAFTASAAAKAGLEGLARSLAAQFAGSGITVNCVVPGFIRKDPGTRAALGADGAARSVPRIPLGRLGLPDEVAATICHLLSEDAGYVTGQSIHVDGGLTL